VPASHNAIDHVRLADGTPDPAPAELTFGALAAATVNPAARKGAPAFNHDSGTCSNTFCHGDALAGAGATLTRPMWNGGSSQAACGTCHGSPPAGDHPQDPDCARCHVSQVHVNAVIDVGQSCTDCHGSASRPLSGAHRSHTEALHELSAPIACTECHTVPAAVGAAGHLDPAPAEVVFGPLAKARGATPVLANGTCTGTACHGVATVDWGPGLGVAVCGSCHAIPPAAGKYHTPGLKLTDCVTCHGATVDGFGNILFNGGTTTHINGRTDLVAP
jgi:predicted CxxxxCH...CXXCH cytochrome family protein